jgi:uncharacterized membrane protein YozB (DUF420 family)
MLTGPTVILVLKSAVLAVTVLLLASLIALWRGHVWLHGRINLVFFVLTATTLVAFELLIRVLRPDLFQYIADNDSLRQALQIHLCFSVPSALLMPVMLYTGLTGRRRLHLALAWLFGALWVGTFITGVFFLPHRP